MTTFRSDACKEFLEHWLSLREEGQLVPTQTVFLDNPHPKFAPNVHIAEIGESDLILRLMGTALVERWGRDKTGEVIGLDQPPKIRDALFTNSKISHAVPSGFRQVIEFASQSGSEMAVEAVVLPLTLPDERTPRVVSYSTVLQKLAYGDHSERYLGVTEAEWIDVGAGVPDQPTHIVPRSE